MKNCAAAALRNGFTEPVRDALWGHIYLTPELEKLTYSSVFIRLHRIAQLGPANFCYPGATHTRAAHSLGVYHLTRRMLSVLCERGASEWLSYCGIRSMLCAALLHDAGHFPYAHSLKELPLDPHEKLSGILIRSSPVNSLIAHAGGDPEITAAIVDCSIDAKGDAEILFYRKLLSGCLDPDKLDYLNRDARYCGVPYGAQDIDFIFSMLYPHPERGVDVGARGITSVESILFSKYMMYSTVYWHHSVRCATAMVKKSLLAGLMDNILQAQDLYNLTDAELFGMMRAREHPLFNHGLMAYRGQFFSLAAEFPFGGGERKDFSDIMNRPRYENNLAAALSSETGIDIEGNSLIIDIPEPFSFETDLFIRGEDCQFDKSTSFFSGNMAEACIKSLRIARVFIDGDVYSGHEELLKKALHDVFDSIAGG
ncbi:MAG: HD domain-containing protein [Treponema sp.]|jgi:HD superfamily phosphohydrolase|nr:HD domain-containing protein [Treponema sp.]